MNKEIGNYVILLLRNPNYHERHDNKIYQIHINYINYIGHVMIAEFNKIHNEVVS
jgi:hypothetical protein